MSITNVNVLNFFFLLALVISWNLKFLMWLSSDRNKFKIIYAYCYVSALNARSIEFLMFQIASHLQWLPRGPTAITIARAFTVGPTYNVHNFMHNFMWFKIRPHIPITPIIIGRKFQLFTACTIRVNPVIRVQLRETCCIWAIIIVRAVVSAYPGIQFGNDVLAWKLASWIFVAYFVLWCVWCQHCERILA